MKRQIQKPDARWTPGLKKLKVISIRQPWVWLIVNGYKEFEKQFCSANLCGPAPKQAMIQEHLTGRTRLI